MARTAGRSFSVPAPAPTLAFSAAIAFAVFSATGAFTFGTAAFSVGAGRAVALAVFAETGALALGAAAFAVGVRTGLAFHLPAARWFIGRRGAESHSGHPDERDHDQCDDSKLISQFYSPFLGWMPQGSLSL